MKSKIIFIIAFFLSIVAKGQTISSSVISTSGDYYVANENNLSVTIGEAVIDNYNSELYKLNTGFQQGIGNRNLNLKFFLEGLFNGTDMNQASDGTVPYYPAGIADKYQFLIAQSTFPYAQLYNDTAVLLYINGSSTINIPARFTGNNYLVIRNRNHIETWSAIPISFAGDTVIYNFTTSASQAYGNNQNLLAPGIYGVYAGDVNQDGLVDGSDMSDTETDNNNFVTGYVVTDVNGDGLVDGSDMSIVETNNNNFVSAITP